MLVPVAVVDDALRGRVEHLRDHARALDWPTLDGGGDLYVAAGIESFTSSVFYRLPYVACGQRWAVRDLARVERLLAEVQAERELAAAARVEHAV